MHTLVLLTESYPFGGSGEPGFIEPEITHLAKAFSRVIIAPVLDFGQRYELPKNVIVDTRMLHRPSWASKARSLLSTATYKALFADRNRLKSPSDVRSLFAFSAYTLHYRKLLIELISEYSLSLDSTLFYTFWFDYMTAALALIPGTRIVTRCHGQDIYESTPPYISRYWRTKSFESLQACYPVSDFAASYLKSHYPLFRHKIHRSYLGVPTPHVIPTSKSDSNEINIYSCARLVPDKRVVYQFEIISLFARRHPDKKVRWVHVGNGPVRKKLQAAIAMAPTNLQVELTGNIPNEEVHRLLSTRYFDIMLHLSLTEGFGLAVAEAMSYGIPAMVTDTQALPEVVGPTGFTLPVNATITEGACHLEKAIEKAPRLRQEAIARQQSLFNADSIREAFAQSLL